jgi:hypothetical protein
MKGPSVLDHPFILVEKGQGVKIKTTITDTESNRICPASPDPGRE